MDPNQDNQGSDAAGANRQAVFTPQTEPVPPAGNVDAPAQPTVNLSHPYLSNHPTQTFNTDTGDIILNTGPQKPKLNKRPFIIGGVILAIVIILSVIVLFISNGALANVDTKVSRLLQDNYESAKWIENFFAEASHSKLDVNDIFSSEMHESLNRNISSLKKLQSSIAKIKPTRLSSSVQQNFTILQNRLNERVPYYQESIALYNILYESYINNNPNAITELLDSANYYEAITAERIHNYLTAQEQLDAKIKANDCYTYNSETCQKFLEEYYEIGAAFNSSTQLVSAIFAAYYDGSYAQDNRFSPYIDILLEELE